MWLNIAQEQEMCWFLERVSFLFRSRVLPLAFLCELHPSQKHTLFSSQNYLACVMFPVTTSES